MQHFDLFAYARACSLSVWHESCTSLRRTCEQHHTFPAWRIRVKSNNRNWMLVLSVCACAVVLVANQALAASARKARQLSQGESAKVSGLILSRDGDLIRVQD